MKTTIKKVNTEDNFSSPLVPAIVLDLSEDSFDAVWDFLEKAGFKLRNWKDREIIVYGKLK